MKNLITAQLQSIYYIVLISAILFFIHYSLIENFSTNSVLIIPLYKIYLFHFIVTIFLVCTINYKYFQGNENIFNFFIILTLIKMVLAMVFLLPLILSVSKNKTAEVFNFFIPYFFYLAYEVFSITKNFQK